MDIQSILNGTAKFCRQCDVVVLNNVIRKKLRDLPGILPQDSLDESDDLYFCSTTCFMQYAMTHGVTLPTTEEKVINLTEGYAELFVSVRNKLLRFCLILTLWNLATMPASHSCGDVGG